MKSATSPQAESIHAMSGNSFAFIADQGEYQPVRALHRGEEIDVVRPRHWRS